MTASLSLFELHPTSAPRTALLQAAIDRLASSAAAERGAVLTRPEIAGFMLDLSGYTAEQDLRGTREKPSLGWTPRGAHLLLQITARVLDDELEERFRQW